MRKSGFTQLLVCIIMLVNINLFPVYGEDTGADTTNSPEIPVENIKKLDARYYTKMSAYNIDNSNMGRLHDGEYNEPVILNVPGGVLDENSYIDVIFNGNISEVTEFDMACNRGLQPNQSISKFEVCGFDDKEGKWSDEKEEVSVNWSEADGDVIKARVKLDKHIISSRIRIKLTEVKATWETIRIQEFAAYGIGGSGEKIKDIVSEADISTNLTFIHGGVKDLTDKEFATEFRSDCKITEENPAVITFDFRNKYFYVNAIEMISLFAPSTGVKKMNIEYQENGKWIEFEDAFRFDRPNGKGTDSFELDRIDIGKVISGIRFVIKETYFEWNHFRISDIMIYGTPAEAPDFPENINNEIISEDMYKYIFDGDETTVWKSGRVTPATENDYEEICFDLRNYCEITALELFSFDKKISSIKLGYSDDNGTVHFTDNISLNFNNNAADVKINPAFIAKNVVLAVTGAEAGYTINDVNLYGVIPYRNIKALISEFEKTKKYSDYTAAQEQINLIPEAELRTAFLNELNRLADEVKKEENLNVVFDANSKVLKLKGKIFEDGNAGITASILFEGTEVKKAGINISDDGEFSDEINVSDLTDYGNYTVEIKDLKAEFIFRDADSENDIVMFRIDGVNGKITSDSIEIELPPGSSLQGRVPVFTLSENARLYYNNTEIISGTTSLDLSRINKVSVVAEDGSKKDYALNAAVKQKTGGSSGGGGGGGGRRPAGDTGGRISVIPENKPVFADIDKNHWAYDYIKILKDKSIVDGDNGYFYPDEYVKREEAVKMLVMLNQVEISETESKFKDAEGNWSEKYIAAADKCGYVKGISEEEFGIGLNVKRQDLAVMIYRAMKNKPQADYENPFADDADISGYAREAVYALKSLGIISGYGNEFNPESFATRAETAKIICCLND